MIKVFLILILGLPLSSPLSATAQTCTAQLTGNGRTGTMTVQVPTKITWRVTSNPSGLPYFWHVTQDGRVIWNDQRGLGQGVTGPSTAEMYNYISAATYEVYFHAERDSKHDACTSNKIILTVTSQSAGPEPLAQTDCPTGKTCLPNPFASISVNSPGELVALVARLFAGIVAIAAVIFLVFSGFKLMIATNEEAITSAKSSILWSVGGFAVAVLAFTIVSGASHLLGFDPLLPGNAISNTGFISGPGEPGNFWSVATYIMNGVLGLTGIVAVLMIIYYGYRYVAAAGNEESIAAAKTGLKWAIVGFIIVVMAFTIISIVQRLLFFGVPT